MHASFAYLKNISETFHFWLELAWVYLRACLGLCSTISISWVNENVRMWHDWGKKGNGVSCDQSLIYDTVCCNPVDIGQFALSLPEISVGSYHTIWQGTNIKEREKIPAKFLPLPPPYFRAERERMKKQTPEHLYSQFVQFWFFSTLQWHHTATAADEQRLLFHCRRSFCGQSTFHFTGTI